jgi:hypothetical protein
MKDLKVKMKDLMVRLGLVAPVQTPVVKAAPAKKKSTAKKAPAKKTAPKKKSPHKKPARKKVKK